MRKDIILANLLSILMLIFFVVLFPIWLVFYGSVLIKDYIWIKLLGK